MKKIDEQLPGQMNMDDLCAVWPDVAPINFHGGGTNRMTADEVRLAIKKKFNDSRRYVIAEEVGLTTGYSRRRIDMVILDCYESNSFRIDGIEIKVSTADLRRELQIPDKHTAFFEKIDSFTLAAPVDVINTLFI